MRKKNLLLVMEEGLLSQFLREKFSIEGCSLDTIKRPDEAISYIRENTPNVVMADFNIAGIENIEFIRSITTVSPSTSVIVIPRDGFMKKAMDALNAGALFCLKNPFNKVELILTIEKAFEVSELVAENLRLKCNIHHKLMERILGTMDMIEQLRGIVNKLPDGGSMALSLGESRMKKEIVARSLHFASNRACAPFVAINCSALPEDLLESELFGYEKDAFAGAIATEIGRFEAANGGTVFLDEVGSLSPGLQLKILRVLEKKEFERVGGRKTINVDIRVLAATSQDLKKAVKEKKFSEDLYRRLHIIPVDMPPLMERKDDSLSSGKSFP